MNPVRRFWIVSVLSTAVSLVSGFAIAAQDQYLSLDGIKGESVDSKHRDWIEISSFGFGNETTLNIGSQSSGAGAGKVTFNPFTITKKVDKASPLLARAVAGGTHYKTAILEVLKTEPDGKTTAYYRITLTDAFVTRLSANPASNNDSPTESVTFGYGKILIERAARNADGSAGSYVKVPEGYDIKNNLKG
jgi:type VI secretion system secreted protein Hcp